ncbi:MAG: PfkB family carbohydrate kinase, partial [Moraxellaceae bacterium]|nr:PfkB family carbohydrate kinase [Moraxellaceae bacterium]
MQHTLVSRVKQFGQTKQHALVIGDVMLDRYLIGEVSRISPEAPVPVVLLKQQNERAGGAANVAANLALLGIETHILGCVGEDAEGKSLMQLMQANGLDTQGMVTSSYRPTIAKTRILGGHQQMMRLDQENSGAFNPEETSQILNVFQQALANAPAIVVLSDYAKGLLSPTICQTI